jgi:serine kinase of HPr protein (carbohydrate metabolism regulator)
MYLDEVINKLGLEILTESKDFSRTPVTGGYASDLLSCVMSGAKREDVWLTLQAHINIVAVAALLELSAVIITENAQPDETTLSKANQQEVTLLSSREDTYTLAGKLYAMGIGSK